jgi:tetratricopeptide (TPR) repeat protein
MYLNVARPAPHRLAAGALRELRRPGQARIEFRLAFERGDRDALREAVRLYARPESLLELVPDEPRALVALADELLALRRVDEAEAVALAAQQRHGESIETLGRLARVGTARRDAAAVFGFGERMSALEPGNPVGLNTRVNARAMGGDVPGAVELLQKEGLTRFSGDPEIAMTLARLELGRGNTRGCREALEKLPAGVDVGTRVRALGLAASAAERDGETTKALGLMRTALAMRPEDAGLRWRYATTLERIGRLDLALREAEAAASKSPGLAKELEKLRARIEERKRRLEELRRWNDVGVEP